MSTTQTQTRFERKEVITDAVGRTLAALQTYRRGQTVPWAVIETAAGFDRQCSHWSGYWKRLWKTFMRQTGVRLWPDPGVGMKLLTVNEQIFMRADKRRKKAARQMHLDRKELEAIPIAAMSAHQAAACFQQVIAARNARRQVLRELKAGRILARNVGRRP